MPELEPSHQHGHHAEKMAWRGIVVSVTIEASVERVWAKLRDIASHVEWMQDAAEIRFLSEARSGTGIRFECLTRVGPLSLTDVMEITAWKAPHLMAVRHVGLVQGTGEFTLHRVAADHTELRWQEDLSFPWFMGAAAGAWMARPILKRIWRGNLARFKQRVEQP